VRRSIEQSIVRVSKNWLLIRMLRIQEREQQNYTDSVISSYETVMKFWTYLTLTMVFPPLTGIFVIAALIYANFSYFHIPSANFVAFVYLYIRFVQIIANGAGSLTNALGSRIQLHEAANLVRSLTPQEIKQATEREGQLRILSKPTQLRVVAEATNAARRNGSPPRIE